MASLKRSFLTAMGIDAEKVDEIINVHTEVVNEIKNERDKYKSQAEELPAVKKELETLKQSGDKDPYKVKYEALKEEHEKLKTDIKDKETRQAKETAYLNLLKEVGIAEKRMKSVLRCADLDSIKLDKDGKIEGADDLKSSIKTEWEDFIDTTGSKGASPATPPANNGGSTKSKEEIMKIKDPIQRQKAISENLSSFGYEN